MTHTHRRRLLAVLLIGQFMANIDIAIVNVAGPAIQHGLRASGGALEFVISGYTLAYAVLLVTGARLGDTRGYRRMFLAGLGGFTLASLACGLAPEEYTLILARIAQGAAAALMVPQVLSGIHVHFAGPARARAQAMLVLALSGGAVAGQVLGGVLVDADLFGLGWRPIFLINVPIGVLLLVAGLRVMPADRGGAAKRLDLGGVALLSATAMLAIVPLVFGRDLHWPAWTWVSLAASLPARYASDVSGLVNTTAQLSGVVGVATFGTLYLAMAGRPGHAFTVVMTAFAATALVAAVAARAAGRAVLTDLDTDLDAVPGETASLTR